MEARINKASVVSAINNAVYSNVPPCKAYVIANYGDPGLSTDTYCDIRSRFVLAIKDPLKRPLVPQNSDGSSIFLSDNLILVLRPKNLWIDCPSSIQDAGVDLNLPQNVSKIKRMDYDKNVNVGSYSSFSSSNISSINRPYKFGEEILVQKLKNYIDPGDAAFQSLFSMTIQESNASYRYLLPNTKKLGQSLPNKVDENGVVVSGGRVQLPDGNYFYVKLPKEDYENYINSYFSSIGYPTNQMATNMPPFQEYYFGTRKNLTFCCCSYIDMNSDMKARSGNSCLPSIIATPDSFLTAQIRQPTYLTYHEI